MADTKVGAHKSNIIQNVSDVAGPSSTMSHSISKAYPNHHQSHLTMVHLEEEHTSPKAPNQSQSATPTPSNPT